jgi:uncharacterized protein YerC
MLSEILFPLNSIKNCECTYVIIKDLDCTAKEIQTLFSTCLIIQVLNSGWLKAVRKSHVSWSVALITKSIHISKSSTYVVRPKRSWRTRLHSGLLSPWTLSKMSYSIEWKVPATCSVFVLRRKDGKQPLCHWAQFTALSNGPNRVGFSWGQEDSAFLNVMLTVREGQKRRNPKSRVP